jgi:parvulin-like peptidyl-prolyl isomerase
MQLLLMDVAKSNPAKIEELRNDKELRKEQVKSLRQLLAFASQAHRDGLTKDPIHDRELENIRSEVTAVNYDREINKSQKSLPPFGLITDPQVVAFWAAAATSKSREEEFDKFLNAKLELLKAGNPQVSDRVISDDEKDQAKDFFAKIKIYEAEYRAKRNSLAKEFNDKVDLQVKLQQAQYLARAYSEKAAAKSAVTDSEVAAYIAVHPEFDQSKKKAKAEHILARAKAGEDFAKLANEFSEDPGNQGPNGLKLGGIYRDVPKGKMVPQFESAALALQPGQINSGLVETDFGYHVIKLEKKNAAGDLYDARHILISTEITDPADPDTGGKPLKTFVRTKLETEKEERLIKQLIAENNIQVPDDLVVPEITSNASIRKPVAKGTTSKKKPVVKKRR